MAHQRELGEQSSKGFTSIWARDDSHRMISNLEGQHKPQQPGLVQRNRR